MFLGTFKRYNVTRSNAESCTVCAPVEPHLMRYRILGCGSSSCERAVPGLTCSWRGRTLECSKTGEISIHEFSSHVSPVPDPRREFLTVAQKTYIAEMSALRMRPARIRNSMTRKFNLAVEDLPPLAKVQNFANYYRKKKLLNNDCHDEVVAYVKEHGFTGAESETQAFTFGATRDADGTPWVGTGSDSDPCVVGVTTKMLLRRLARAPESFIFHLDATYKLNQVGYPVLACGISDGNRSFHLVALFVMSQQQEAHYIQALGTLRYIYSRVTSMRMEVRYVMGDGDDAQYNACLRVFGSDNQFLYLMCFYHVVANVFKHTKGLSVGSKTRVTKDIYDMHFSRSPEKFVQLRDTALAFWMEDPEIKQFADYFIQQWLRGKFNQWQCYYTPVDFATTNNPIEQYNKVIKRDYSLRSQLKMGTLFKQLVECCFNESSNDRPFRDQPQVSLALKRRVAALKKVKTLYKVFPGVDTENDGVGSAQLKFVVTLRTPRIFVPSKKRTEEVIAVSAQLGDNYARMEVEGQSQWGWAVDFERRMCSCRYWFKFGQCCHLVLIMQNYGTVDVSGKRKFVNRNPARARRNQQQQDDNQEIDAISAGRAPTNGHALSLV